MAAILHITFSNSLSEYHILIKNSLQFVAKYPTSNMPILVLIMAWFGSGDKPLSEPMMAWFTDALMCDPKIALIFIAIKYTIPYKQYQILQLIEVTNFCKYMSPSHSELKQLWGIPSEVVLNALNLPVLKPGCSKRSWSIPWLLIHWLLALPGHQQLWYWLYRIIVSPGNWL